MIPYIITLRGPGKGGPHLSTLVTSPSVKNGRDVEVSETVAVVVDNQLDFVTPPSLVERILDWNQLTHSEVLKVCRNIPHRDHGQEASMAKLFVRRIHEEFGLSAFQAPKWIAPRPETRLNVGALCGALKSRNEPTIKLT